MGDYLKKRLSTTMGNENGSVIVIAILVLAVMTVIGLMSMDTTVTENFIIRNVGLHHQNMQITESAVIEGLQNIVQIRDTATLETLQETPPTGITRLPWLTLDTAWETAPAIGNSAEQDWYDPMSAQVLTRAAVNASVPTAVANDDFSIINTRGEKADQPLLLTLVGWEGAQGASLKATAPTRHAGRILAEYYSDNGMVRMEIGIEKVF